VRKIKSYCFISLDSLDTADWQDSEIISGDVARKLTDIKAQD
jgi:hypothetical protein